MQFRPLLALTAAAALIQVSYATQPHPPSAQELGAAQGVLDFCSRVDHDDGKAFDTLRQRALQGLTPQQIEQIKKSEAYKQSYAALQSALGKLAAANAQAACKAVAPASHPDKNGVGRGK
jgi:hypothetical protein